MEILIVEDEWLIAEELKASLEDLGHKILGPALNCAQALDLLATSSPDVALLDTQLGDDTCEPVFEACTRLGIPVVISSGHNASALPSIFKDCILVVKPHASNALVTALARAAGLAAGPSIR